MYFKEKERGQQGYESHFYEVPRGEKKGSYIKL